MRKYNAKPHYGEAPHPFSPIKTLLLIAACAFPGAGCSITLPGMGWASLDDEPAAARSTASLATPAPAIHSPATHSPATHSPATALAISPLPASRLSALASPAPKGKVAVLHDAAFQNDPSRSRNDAFSKDAVFPKDLGPEDLRRAHGALALALDPQGNGQNVAWDNPQSGMKGLITPLGSPFLKSDEICRDFRIATTLQSGSTQQKGLACRPSGGEWVIKAVEPALKS